MPFTRKYTDSDYMLVEAWNRAAGIEIPPRDRFPLESTFVGITDNGEPAVIAATYLTNTPAWAVIENLIGNPSVNKLDRKRATAAGLEYIEHFVRALGYKGILAITQPDKLKNYYMEMGFDLLGDKMAVLLKQVK